MITPTFPRLGRVLVRADLPSLRAGRAPIAPPIAPPISTTTALSPKNGRGLGTPQSLMVEKGRPAATNSPAYHLSCATTGELGVKTAKAMLLLSLWQIRGVAHPLMSHRCVSFLCHGSGKIRVSILSPHCLPSLSPLSPSPSLPLPPSLPPLLYRTCLQSTWYDTPLPHSLHLTPTLTPTPTPGLRPHITVDSAPTL